MHIICALIKCQIKSMQYLGAAYSSENIKLSVFIARHHLRPDQKLVRTRPLYEDVFQSDRGDFWPWRLRVRYCRTKE